ncbi:G-type lectin S-receptor-like serine/threonine-protein kinase At2g19130 [Triticum aestivum]|uniref:G-type lectin S-receptor-like serine/threonine-protein kinase At2g19130 n=1 Tax=Triticum aestivum TaxID=4565 RepID=UPI001D005D2C|nr:G-type lectin S-receptor-like serine/threonine-protein kinase At2g19130 [Triticum aestivum]
MFSMPPLYILSLGLLLFHTTLWPSFFVAANNDTLMAGQVLAVGGRIASRNAKFALGFFQFQPASTISKSSYNTTSPIPSLWYLGIWFNKIPVCTYVWVANRDQPIADPIINQTRFKISSDGNLVIVNHAANNESIVWSTRVVNNRTHLSRNNTSTTVLLNSGNLALKESPSSDLPVWQSFDYPTDVILPGAKFGRNKVTGFSHQAISMKSLIDPGPGSYSYELEQTKGLVLKRLNPLVEYWLYASSTKSSFNLVPMLKAVLDMDPRTKGLMNPTYVNNDQEEYYMYTSLDESSSFFILLDISGQIKLNLWSQDNQSWQTIYAIPDDPCIPPATCGPYTKSNANVVVLNWNIRYQISLGVARGLCYLHQGCPFVGRDFSRILTSFRGTVGYLAPEWLTGVAITPKVDVYGFGMVLLEIISGRRNSSPETSYDTSSSNSNQNIEYFPVQAISKLHDGDLKSLVDPRLHGGINLEEAERVCKVACWCIQDNELDRPTMGEVVRVLEGLQEIDVPPIPRLLAAIAE